MNKEQDKADIIIMRRKEKPHKGEQRLPNNHQGTVFKTHRGGMNVDDYRERRV